MGTIVTAIYDCGWTQTLPAYVTLYGRRHRVDPNVSEKHLDKLHKIQCEICKERARRAYRGR